MADELKHWGVLGMKWGRRKDRSSGTESADHITSRTIKRKKLSEMSNEELKTLTTRLQLEKQYADLNKRQVSAGEKLVGNVLSEVGKDYAKNFITKTLVPVVVPKIQGAVTNGVEELLKKLASKV